MGNFGYVPALQPDLETLAKPESTPDQKLVERVKEYIAQGAPASKMQVTIMMGLLGRYVIGGSLSSVSAGIANLERVMSTPENHKYLQAAIGMTGQDYECDPIERPESFYENLCSAASGWFKNPAEAQPWTYSHDPRPQEEKVAQKKDFDPAIQKLIYLLSTTKDQGDMDARVSLALKATPAEIENVREASMGYLRQNMDKAQNVWEQQFTQPFLSGNRSIAQAFGLTDKIYFDFVRTEFEEPMKANQEMADKMWQSMMTVDGFKSMCIGVLKLLSYVPETNVSDTLKEFTSGNYDDKIRLTLKGLKTTGLKPEDFMYPIQSMVEVLVPGGIGEAKNLDYLTIFDDLLKTTSKFDKKANPTQILGGVMQIIEKAGLSH